MDGYGQSFLGSNYYSFNLLQPSYHDEQAFNMDCSFDDGFGFDPSPTEHTMLGRSFDIAELLSVKPLQTPCQIAPSCLLRQSNDQMLAPGGYNNSRVGPSCISDVGYAVAEALDKEKIPGEPATPSSHSPLKRRRDKVQDMEVSVPPRRCSNSTKREKETSHDSSTVTKLSLGSAGVDKQKELSLEKNRVAASKCRMKRKEKSNQMLQESRTKAKENKELHGLVHAMETELRTLTAVLSAHSHSSSCKQPDEVKQALRLVRGADPSRHLPELSDASPTAGIPALSFSAKSPSDDSYGPSPTTPSPSTAYTSKLDSYLLFDAKVVSLLDAEDAED